MLGGRGGGDTGDGGKLDLGCLIKSHLFWKGDRKSLVSPRKSAVTGQSRNSVPPPAPNPLHTYYVGALVWHVQWEREYIH